MDDRAELYWRMYQENCTQGRHHETQRATVTTILASVAAAALAFVRPDDLPISKGYVPLGLLVAAIGVFGAVVTRKQYERFALHMRRASKYRNALDAMFEGLSLRRLKNEADEAHYKRFKLLGKVGLTWLWVLLHIVVATAGVLITVMAATQYKG